MFAKADTGHENQSHRLGVSTGLAALSLDAMASVAYGPEAIVLVLAAAGGVGLGFTVPVTLAIAVLLAVLVASYRQVIAAYPNGGGAYAVASRRLGKRPALVAAASLIIDYTLNVAVSIAAGVAALTSAFPELLPYAVWIALAILVAITAVNLRGIASSARAFMLPTAVFVGSILTVVVVGLLRSDPAGPVRTAESVAADAQTIGILLLLKAFSSGCAALTGVEAIANAVPSFREPRVRTAQRTLVALGVLLSTMLIGLAMLIEKFDIRPVAGTTVLSQVTEAALGSGAGYYVVQFATVILLALAANTSFGGLPVLMGVLAEDNALPHRLGRRNGREVYVHGVLTLAVVAGLVLAASDANTNALVPLFAIGVFIGFTLAQAGMVKHWWDERTTGWRWRAWLNGVGAVSTFVALLVTTAMKFTEGAWLIVIAVPVLMVLMQRVQSAYAHIDSRLAVDAPTRRPVREIGRRTTVLVAVSDVTRLTDVALSTATALSEHITAVHVCRAGERTDDFTRAWSERYPGVGLILLDDTEHSVGRSIARYIRVYLAKETVMVVVAAVDTAHAWHRLLPTQRRNEIADDLRQHSHAAVCQVPVRIDSAPTGV